MADIGTMYATMGVKLDGIIQAQKALETLALTGVNHIKQIEKEVQILNGQLTTLGAKAKAIQAPKVITPRMDIASVTGFFDGVTKGIQQMSQRVRTFGYLASAVITAPIIMIGKSTMNMAMDFEFSMHKMVGLAGLAKSSITEFGDELKKLSNSTGVGLQQTVDTFYFIKSSGYDAAEALTMTKASASGAASGMGEAKDIANLLTSAMNAYSAEGLTAARTMDVLTTTIREGKAEPAAMVNAFGSILPFAQKLGLNIEQVGGALASMTLVTNSTAMSATYFRNVLQKLIDPTPQVRKAFVEMKTSVEEIHNMLRKPDGFIKTMQFLDDTTKKYGKDLSDVFPEMRALLGALNFTGDGMTRLQKITDATNRSSGEFQKHAEEMAATLKVRYNVAMTTLKNSLLDVGMAIAKNVIPVLTGLAAKITEMVNRFDSLTAAQQQHKLKWFAIAAAAGPVALLFSAVGYAVAGVIGLFTGFVKVVTFTISVVRAYNGSMAAMTLATNLYGKSARNLLVNGPTIMASLVNPWVLLCAAIVAATVAAGHYIKKMGEIPKDTQTQLNVVTDPLTAMTVDPFIGSEAIGKRMDLVSQMNPAQLTALKNDIAARIQAEKDYNITILQTKKEGLKDDKFIVDQKAIIAKKELQIDEWNKNGVLKNYLNGVGNPTEATTKYFVNELNIAQAQADIDAANAAINKERSESKQFIEDQLEGIPKVIGLYEGYGRTVTQALAAIEGPMEKQRALQDQITKESEDITKVFSDLAAGESSIIRVSAIMGASYNATQANTELLSKALEALAGTSIPLTDKRLEELKNRFTALNEKVSLDKLNLEWAKFGNNINTTADLIKKGMDPQFWSMVLGGERKDDSYTAPLERKVNKDGKTTGFNIPDSGKSFKIPEVSTMFKSQSDVIERLGGVYDLMTGKMVKYNNISGKTLRTVEPFKFKTDTNTGAFTEQAKIMKELEKELTLGEFRMSFFGDAINAVGTQMDAYAKAAESLSATEEYIKGLPTAVEEMDRLKLKYQELASVMEREQSFKKFSEHLSRVWQDASGALSAYGNLVEAQKQNQLAAIDNIAKRQNRSDKWVTTQKEKIEQDFARKQQRLAIAIAVMNGAVAITKAFEQTGVFGWIAAALIAVETGMQVATIKAQKFAEGGIVPSGFPNDTYPARLTSGETVIPPKKLDEVMRSINQSDSSGVVEFKIKDTYLVGILEKHGRKINSFR